MTNLNDNGPGSLRAALTRSGSRIVVATVSGSINLQSRILAEGNVTVYGNGLTLSGEVLAFEGGENAIIHDLRVRLDASTSSPNDADALSIANWDGFVADHCCFGWAVDENIGISNSQNVSIQNCIIHEGLYDSVHPSGPHSMGTLVSMGSTRITFYRTLFVHNGDRNPGLQAENVLMETEFINNVVFNPGTPAGGGGNVGWFMPRSAGARLNLVGNTYKRGPSTGLELHRQAGLWLYTGLASVTLEQQYADLVEVFESDNAGDGGDWLLEYDASGEGAQIIYPPREPGALALSGAITPMSRADAYAWVLAYAGTMVRDSHEQRVVNDVINGTGAVINDPSEIS